ncbi:MAG: hydantoinase B/oxoprolinase family protein [Betaproteobacteria bacterium]|nr:hydantoinase B/oxoprolinase family protein [Betaproteobacteria bacterium]
MSERKLSNSTTLDPVTLAVLKGRLEQVADEMDATLYRSAFNPIIAEAHDACHGIYDGITGDTLVQGKSGLPVFVGAMAFAVRAAAKAAATRGGMQDGDIWLFNDPYEGGTHANDFKLVRPFFRNGQLFCFLASAAHWHDVGGAVPGNYNPAATECWQEAVQIPPVRILRAGVLDEDVLAILRANTRLPDSLWGDLNGQLAALELGAKRLANAGVLDAVDFIIPDRLVISAERPRPVGGYTETILRMIDVIFSATALADPKRAVAHAYGTINALSIAGHRTDEKRKGQRWVMFSFFGGGHGGHSDADGLSHSNAPISTATIPPLEILEAAYPVRFTQWALRANSGGDGLHRGGLGAVYEIELLEESAEAFIFGERGKASPKGIAGGQPALPNVFEYENEGVWKTPPMVSKMLGIRLKKGERVRLQTPGGGGWGKPSDRSAEARAKDIEAAYVSKEKS